MSDSQEAQSPTEIFHNIMGSTRIMTGYSVNRQAVILNVDGRSIFMDLEAGRQIANELKRAARELEINIAKQTPNKARIKIIIDLDVETYDGRDLPPQWNEAVMTAINNALDRAEGDGHVHELAELISIERRQTRIHIPE